MEQLKTKMMFTDNYQICCTLGNLGETSLDFLLEDVKYSIHCTKPVKLEFFQILAQNKNLKISDDKNLCQNLNIGMNFPEIFGLARGLLSTWGR